MSRERVNTTVDGDLLAEARARQGGCQRLGRLSDLRMEQVGAALAVAVDCQR